MVCVVLNRERMEIDVVDVTVPPVVTRVTEEVVLKVWKLTLVTVAVEEIVIVFLVVTVATVMDKAVLVRVMMAVFVLVAVL